MFIYNMLLYQLPHSPYSRSPFTHRLQLYMSMSINWTNLGSQNQSHHIMRYFSSLHRGLDRLRNSFICLYSYTSECICIHNTYSNHSKCMRCEHVSLRVLQSKSSSSVATPFILATWLRPDTIEYYTHMTHVMKKNILVIGDWTMCMHHTVFSIDLRLEASIELSIFIQTHMHVAHDYYSVCMCCFSYSYSFVYTFKKKLFAFYCLPLRWSNREWEIMRDWLHSNNLCIIETWMIICVFVFLLLCWLTIELSKRECISNGSIKRGFVYSINRCCVNFKRRKF